MRVHLMYQDPKDEKEKRNRKDRGASKQRRACVNRAERQDPSSMHPKTDSSRTGHQPAATRVSTGIPDLSVDLTGAI
eukprot:15466862-Alexandrium_andersonii.AAC.1